MILHVLLVLMVVVLALPPSVQAGSPREQHAQTQLQALLEARPSLARGLESRPEVRDWILQQFRDTDPPIYWDDEPPITGRLAEWDARDPERITLRVKPKGPGIDQLAILLFELHNIQAYEVFETVHEQAVRDEISREEYTSRMLRQEFENLLAARDFYRAHLSDLSRAEQKQARNYYRLAYGTDSYEEHLAEHESRGKDLLEHWRWVYDTIVLEERKQLEEN